MLSKEQRAISIYVTDDKNGNGDDYDDDENKAYLLRFMAEKNSLTYDQFVGK